MHPVICIEHKSPQHWIKSGVIYNCDASRAYVRHAIGQLLAGICHSCLFGIFGTRKPATGDDENHQVFMYMFIVHVDLHVGMIYFSSIFMMFWQTLKWKLVRDQPRIRTFARSGEWGILNRLMRRLSRHWPQKCMFSTVTTDARVLLLWQRLLRAATIHFLKCFWNRTDRALINAN